MRRQIGLCDEAVGGLDIGNAGQRQFFRQPILQGGEHPLRAAPGFRRIGRDMLDAQLPQRPSDLRQPALVDRLAGALAN